MQLFKNVIHPCFLNASPEELVGEKLPLPELYLLKGVVNQCYKVLQKVWLLAAGANSLR